MPYVITCGDEGIQLNEGTRIGVVGAGFRFPHFSEVVAALKKTCNDVFFVVASEENDWVREQLQLSTWEQTDASMQQHIEALADREKLTYAGLLSFTDPKVLKAGVKGHMVRPHGVHIANKICFTLGGGEQKYNLGNYIISADWLMHAPLKIAREVILAQVAFYTKLSKKKLTMVFELGGQLGEAVAAENKKILDKILAA